MNCNKDSGSDSTHHHQLKARIMRDLGITAVNVSTSLVKEADSRKCVTRVHEKITQICTFQSC